MTQPLINVIFTGIVSLVAFDIIWFWHRKTRGTWKDWPAGRSLMYMLGIIAVGFGYGVFNQFMGPYAARPFIGLILYLMFIAALIVIRFTIAAEMRRGERKRLKTAIPTATGPVEVVVATENEAKEQTHDR